jgi:hypothetical protein
MRPRLPRRAAVAAALLLTAGAAAAAEDPCVPVKPCEIPDDVLAAPAEAPADFAAEARRLLERVTCASAPASDRRYCAEQRRLLAAGREEAARRAALLGDLRGSGFPTAVVVPSGADLAAALATYPELRNVTTLSPEPAGDPRRLAAAPPSATRAPLLRFLTALAVHGYEPVGLRFFRVEPDGTLRYLGAKELASGDAFRSSELTFVKRGEDPRTRARVHRHVATDVSDAALARSPGIVAHLKAKGPFAAVARGAATPLAGDDHARIRELLAAQAVVVVSDAATLPAAVAAQARFVQETRGAGAGRLVVARKAPP